MVKHGEFIDPEEGLTVIREICKKNFPNFVIEKEYNWGGFHGFGMILKKDNIKIEIGGARGTMDFSLVIDNEGVDLFRYDEGLQHFAVVNEINLHYVLSVMKRFLSEWAVFGNLHIWTQKYLK